MVGKESRAILVHISDYLYDDVRVKEWRHFRCPRYQILCDDCKLKFQCATTPDKETLSVDVPELQKDDTHLEHRLWSWCKIKK